MILKINKLPKDLKIGITGARSDCFVDPLIKHGYNFHKVSLSDVDESYDFILESGLYAIIPEDILNKPKMGFIGIHESPLPEGRGWAPIQWAVLNKRKNLTVTLYKLDKGVDSGNIIYQYHMPIERTDVLADLDKKRKIGISRCVEEFLEELKEGVIVLRKQTGKGDYHKRRTKDDTELNPEKSLADLWDNIRICDNEDYPAFFYVDGKKVILRYEVV